MIVLPFPSSALAGNGQAMGAAQWSKIKLIREHREWAKLATLEAKPVVPDEGDILITVRFVPPNNRGDRVGYPYRMKAYFDGVADGLGVNDKRFLPAFEFAEPEKPGRVEIVL